MTTPLEDGLRWLDCARPYLDQLVVCGGWAVWCYQWLPQLHGTSAALKTDDVDIAVPNTLRAPAGTPSLLALSEAADFVRHISATVHGEAIERLQPARYPPNDLAPFHIEFLTPKLGRDRRAVAKAVGAGVVAQRLSFMQLALEAPIWVDLSHLSPGLRVQVPEPARFVLHKGLVLGERRKVDERGKDLAYIALIARMSRAAEVRRGMVDQMRRATLQPTGRKWAERARANYARYLVLERDEVSVAVDELNSMGWALSDRDFVIVVGQVLAELGIYG